MQLTPELRRKLLAFQKNEITEAQIYRRLANRLGSPENRAVLQRIADDELGHYQALREVTGQEVAPDRWQVFKYTLIARLFGFTFAVKLMERGEESAQENYEKVLGDVEGAGKLLHDENVHEEKLLAMLDEELLRYAGSIVLGLNDAWPC
jgi:rubrerythrin